MAPFVVGVPRSGTTLLRLMLDAHPQLAMTPETGFLRPILRSPRYWLGAYSRDRFAAALTGSSSWADVHIHPETLRRRLSSVTPFRVDEGVRAFYQLYAERFAKPFWGDKTPAYGCSARAIARLLPEARFIHIIRDGRDVALSLQPMWFSPSQRIGALAAFWAGELERIRKQGRGLRYYLEVRYEALVETPEEVLRAITRFLDLPYDAAMLSYHERAATRLDELEARPQVTKANRRLQQWRTAQPPDLTRVARWRQEMDVRSLDEFDRVAGRQLLALGYPMHRQETTG